MTGEIKFVFVSNYLNHHQIPFCNAMYGILKGSFVFIQTEAMEEERVRMGWNEQISRPYLKLYYREPEVCRELIAEAEAVMFGGTDEEGYIEARLEAGKPVIRYSERLYKTGQWKAVSPRGLIKKYHDHTRYRRSPVYLLCAGAYVASDFRIVRAYPGKMYCWGYFPETRHYDVEKLLAGKGWRETGEPGNGAAGTAGNAGNDGMVSVGEVREAWIPYILWAARMIDWKHPELPMETARYLKEKGIAFHMDIIGGGDMLEQLKTMRKEYRLEAEVGLPGFMSPEQVREHMERADIFLFTSDRQEGWGAVANEAMNSGCALAADHMIGAVPYLVHHGENGMIYEDGSREELFALTEKLAGDRELCRRLGRKAYETITECWNPENAAERLALLCVKLGLLGKDELEIADFDEKQKNFDREGENLPKKMSSVRVWRFAPCGPAKVISEARAGRLIREQQREERN